MNMCAHCTHMCVCMDMYASQSMHSLKFSLFRDIWLPDPDTLSQRPQAGSVSAPRRLHFHTSSAEKKVGARRMCLFIKAGAAWIFQTGNMIPRCHPTQRRVLWLNFGVRRAEVKSQIWKLASRHHLLAVTGGTDEAPELGAVDGVRLNPIWPCLHVSVPGLPLELAVLWKGTSPGMCLHCWLCVCVDGEDRWACGHTRHSRLAIKPNWRWGIKPGLLSDTRASEKVRQRGWGWLGGADTALGEKKGGERLCSGDLAQIVLVRPTWTRLCSNFDSEIENDAPRKFLYGF